jgi:hypothetical protein
MALTLPKVIEARNQVVKINLGENTAQTAPEANQTEEAKAA